MKTTKPDTSGDLYGNPAGYLTGQAQLFADDKTKRKPISKAEIQEREKLLTMFPETETPTDERLTG